MTVKPLGPRHVARATGVSTDTLRHYERQGLLPGVLRTSAGYRRYTSATVQRVLLIQRALGAFSPCAIREALRAAAFARWSGSVSMHWMNASSS
jgi:MerR family copper efflux transcriptional regulator